MAKAIDKGFEEQAGSNITSSRDGTVTSQAIAYAAKARPIAESPLLLRPTGAEPDPVELEPATLSDGDFATPGCWYFGY
jgi:hypothetical protein